MRKRLVLLALIVLFVVVAATGISYVLSSRKPVAIETTGTVEGIEVNLSPKISGRIAYICCNEGDSVKEGQTVVELDNEDLKASVELAKAGIEKAKSEIDVYESMVENAKANFQSAQADIKAANADAEKARTQMELAKKEMDRSSTLYKDGLISNDEYDVAVAKYRAATADYASATSRLASVNSKATAAESALHTAESRIVSSKADLKQAQANLAYDEARLADTKIISPINGTVVFKSLEQGETVSPGITILTIVDLGHLYVRTDIEETLVADIKLGKQAVITTEGSHARTFEGTISEIGRYAEFATQKDVQRGRQEIRTFRVKISLPNTGGALKPGMTVGVKVPVGTA